MANHLTVFERGWLSSNGILLQGQHGAALIDSGYGSHASQTVSLVQQALQGRPLDTLLNTHLHSDHCGGNAALQQAWPGVMTYVPRASIDIVRQWDEDQLSYKATGQQCPRFEASATLQAGDELLLGDGLWQVHAAAGHDPDMVVLFEPASGQLISADALWENGFGIIFPELEGEHAFETMANTLDVIERLEAKAVIPGHGRPFTDVSDALARARQRLDYFIKNPHKHAHYAAKALLKFKILEWQHISHAGLQTWGLATPYLERLRDLMGQHHTPMPQWLDQTVQDLVNSQAAIVNPADGSISNL